MCRPPPLFPPLTGAGTGAGAGTIINYKMDAAFCACLKVSTVTPLATFISFLIPYLYRQVYPRYTDTHTHTRTRVRMGYVGPYHCRQLSPAL